MTARHEELNAKAKSAAERVTTWIGKIDTNIAAVLGTGWGDSAALTKRICLAEIDQLFVNLADLSGHARKLGIANIGGKRVLVVSGRVHMYEGDRDAVYLLMRILWELGIRKLILTSATGGMRDCIRKGDIVVITDLIKNLASPADGPPFPNPHSMIPHELMQRIFRGATVGGVHIGHCVSNAGPDFESPGDRLQIDRPGVQCVGMSGRPEATCFASFVEQDGLKAGKHAIVVHVTCISNGLNDPHGHKSNTETMRQHQDRLFKMLLHTVLLTAKHPVTKSR